MDMVIDQIRLYAELNGEKICKTESFDDRVYIPVDIVIDSWVNYTTRYDRGIGKTVSVARLSAKYDIPVFVKNNMCKRFIENEVPKYLPRYFKKRKPKAIVAGSKHLKGHRYEVALIDEPLSLTDVDNIETWCRGKLVGYVIE